MERHGLHLLFTGLPIGLVIYPPVGEPLGLECFPSSRRPIENNLISLSQLAGNGSTTFFWWLFRWFYIIKLIESGILLP